MRQSIRLGRVAGIEVGVNWSVLVIAGLLAWGLSGSVLPEAAPGHRPGAYLAGGLLVAVLFLGCILAHELAHAVVARWYGIEVRRITLWLLGGVSELHDEAPTPSAELAVAGAGPLMSVLVGGVAGLTAVWARVAGFGDLVVAGLLWLAGVNVVLGLFNLLPGAPLDGGRILRAVLWRARGDRYAAQISADRAGTVVGTLLVAGGLALTLFSQNLSGLWLLLLGWYLVSAATAESEATRVRAVLDRLTVADIMTPQPVCAAAAQTVEEFVTVAGTVHHRMFPVADDGGRLVGVVDLARLALVPPAERMVRRIGAIAAPVPGSGVVRPSDRATVAARAFTPRVPLAVVVDGGQVVGVVCPADIARAVELAPLSRPSPR